MERPTEEKREYSGEEMRINSSRRRNAGIQRYLRHIHSLCSRRTKACAARYFSKSRHPNVAAAGVFLRRREEGSRQR
jgi:hypothetical protein